MKKSIIVVTLLMLVLSSYTVGAVSFHSSSFGGSVTVTEPVPTWHTSSFGGSVSVYGWGNWSGYWRIQQVESNAPPSNLSTSTLSNSSISLSWVKGLGADRTEIRMQKGSYPDWGDGALIYNSTGESYNALNLDVGTHYYFRAWSWNDTNGRSSSTTTNSTYTKPGEVTNLHNTSIGANSISLSWTKGLNASRTVIRYSTGSYPITPQLGSDGYNNTGTAVTLNSLSANTTYYIRAWGFVNPFSEGYVDLAETTLNTSVPDPPYNGSMSFYTGGILNISWERGNRSNEDVVVRKSSGYPATYDDGVIVDRTNNSTASGRYYYTASGVTQPYYYCVFSYNMTHLSYSAPLQIPQYTALGLNCFNESNPSQAINFDILITNKNASSTYFASDVSNTLWINIEDIPYGNDTVFLVSNSSYKQRQYYYDISVGVYLNLSFYLPPLEVENPENGTGGNTGTLRTCTNVISVNNSTVNATIPLTHILDNVIEVAVYNVLYDEKVKTDTKTVATPSTNLTIYLTHESNDVISVEVYNVVYKNRLKTDSISVSNPSANVSIPFTETWDSIVGVYIWNSSIYGGWVTVPDDKYSINETDCEIDSSVMDDNTTIAKVEYYYLAVDYGKWDTIPEDKYSASDTQVEIDSSVLSSNTTMARIQYYYLEAGVGQWVVVPEDKYSASDTQVEIDSSVLSSNTTMAKAEYYYMSYTNETTETKLYILKVINDFDIAVPNAKVTISRYIFTTSSFEPVTILRTDGNGQAECYLMPYTLYKVFIEAENYYDLEVSEWIPDAEFYGIYHPKTFRIAYEQGSGNISGGLFDNIIWNIDPDIYYHNNSFTMWFNITSTDAKIEWYTASLYYYNNTNMSWVLLNTTNITTSPGGGSISFVAPNVTGRYSFTCTFKKEGYPPYTFGMGDGCRTYWVYYSYIVKAVSTIPDNAYLVIAIVFALLIMGFLVKFGAGVNAGFAGLGVMGGMFALRPDLAFGSPPVSIWIIFTATTIAYLIVLFLSSRSS